MIVSAQALAVFLEQDYSAWSTAQKTRAAEHVLTAGDEARGGLAALYTIPTYARDASGAITLPLVGATPAADPVRTALGPIVKLLAASTLLNPSRGMQPQEDRTAASEYRAAARQQLAALQAGRAFIMPLDQLAAYGIVATNALMALITSRRRNPRPGMRQLREGMFGSFHDPDGTDFDRDAINEGERP